MRKTLATLLATALLFLASATPAALKDKTHQKAWDATFVLYGHSDETHVTMPLCSAFAYKKTVDGYLLLTVGHCFSSNAHADATYSVTEDVSPNAVKTLQPVTVLRSINSGDVDAAELELKTKKVYPVLELDNRPTTVDELIFSAGFPDAIEKQIQTGRVAGNVITVNPDPDCTVCLGRIPAQMAAAPGASGSAIVDAKTGKVVGILEGQESEGIVFIFPITKVTEWLNKKQ